MAYNRSVGMKLNLDVLKTEIREEMENRGLAIFHGFARAIDHQPIVFWDTYGYPEYKQFLDAGQSAGAKLFVLHAREFSSLLVDNALEQLDESDFAPEDRRTVERRLRDLRAYDGFTCAIEVSFDISGCAYMFELRTDWYDEFSDLLDELDAAAPESEPDSDEGTIGGYFSKN